MANPTLQELINRCNADFIEQFDGADPTITNSFIGAFPEMVAGRAFEIYGALSLLAQRLLLNSTADDFTAAWASALKMTQKPATAAKGTLVITGSVGTNIPINTIFNSDQGISYQTDSLSTIVTFNDTSASFSVDGVSVTVTTSIDHNLATGLTVTISPLNLPAEIIGTYTIVVISANQFSYTTATAATNGVYPNGIVQANRASVDITATSLGANTNAETGTQLSILSPIAGVSSTAFVSLSGLTGGADVEDNTAFRDRVLFRVRNPIAYQSVSMIENYMYSLGGVTRVWVSKLVPTNGYTVYYVRDEQSSIFPSPADVAAIDAAFPKPAEIPSANVVIAAPTERSIEFTFTSITPDTETMREAVEASLRQFFRDVVTMGFVSSTITVNQFSRPIQTAIDITTGQALEDYVLATVDGVVPANIIIADDELPTLGNVTF